MERNYYSREFDAENLQEVRGAFHKLVDETIKNREDLELFIEKYSELGTIIEEVMAWKYIKMTQFADKEEYSKAFNEFYGTIVAEFNKVSFDLNNKIYGNENFDNLDHEKFGNYKLILKNEIEMYDERNIPLQVKESELSSKYGEIISQITIDHEGESYTLSQMKKFLKSNDREVRKNAWEKIALAIKKKSGELNKLFDELMKLRLEMAKNKGFDNYRDYMHKLKGRFSYTPEDLYKFHSAVEKVVVPFLKELNEKKRINLEIENLKPWDTEASEDGKILKPFKNVEEFLERGVAALKDVKKEFGDKLQQMAERGFLDLENRKGKAPGGYNYPLNETGAAFIFMNAIGVHSDVVTLMHESGHALHSFATKDEKIECYKDTPSEVAELASMSMEFLSMDSWGRYYEGEDDLKKARREQIVGALETFPWVMTVDAFQHWIYLNPDHTVEERGEKFKELMNRFNTGVDWNGMEEEMSMLWLKQLHIFEVPFYYVEYAISQLGAIGIYKNYKKDPENALARYEKFMSLGYSKSIEEIYESAGIKFDFSEGYISELEEFLKEELRELK